MAASSGFSELAGKVSVFLGQCGGMFYLAAIILSVAEVFMRYVMDAPTAWTTETVMALCGTAWLLSIGAVTQQNRHITVTAVELLVGPKLWHKMSRIAILISLLAATGMMWAASEPAMHAVSHLERSGSAFNPPTPSFMKVALLLACLLYALQLIANLIAHPELHDHGSSHANLDADMEQ